MTIENINDKETHEGTGNDGTGGEESVARSLLIRQLKPLWQHSTEGTDQLRLHLRGQFGAQLPTLEHDAYRPATRIGTTEIFYLVDKSRCLLIRNETHRHIYVGHVVFVGDE